MADSSRIKFCAVTLDCRDHLALAQFYAALLNWEVAYHDDDYVCVGPPGAPQGAYPWITFQRNPDCVPPVWPEESGAQQQMEHLDFAVDDLEASVRHAVACGATVAPAQFSDWWTVLFDPAGHPFCLCLMKNVMESSHFALR
jgi:hypothetical protein